MRGGPGLYQCQYIRGFHFVATVQQRQWWQTWQTLNFTRIDPIMDHATIDAGGQISAGTAPVLCLMHGSQSIMEQYGRRGIRITELRQRRRDRRRDRSGRTQANGMRKTGTDLQAKAPLQPGSVALDHGQHEAQGRLLLQPVQLTAVLRQGTVNLYLIARQGCQLNFQPMVQCTGQRWLTKEYRMLSHQHDAAGGSGFNLRVCVQDRKSVV